VKFCNPSRQSIDIVCQGLLEFSIFEAKVVETFVAILPDFIDNNLFMTNFVDVEFIQLFLFILDYRCL
jgi:hypothetical protein